MPLFNRKRKGDEQNSSSNTHNHFPTPSPEINNPFDHNSPQVQRYIQTIAEGYELGLDEDTAITQALLDAYGDTQEKRKEIMLLRHMEIQNRNNK